MNFELCINYLNNIGMLLNGLEKYVKIEKKEINVEVKEINIIKGDIEEIVKSWEDIGRTIKALNKIMVNEIKTEKKESEIFKTINSKYISALDNKLNEIIPKIKEYSLMIKENRQLLNELNKLEKEIKSGKTNELLRDEIKIDNEIKAEETIAKEIEHQLPTLLQSNMNYSNTYTNSNMYNQPNNAYKNVYNPSSNIQSKDQNQILIKIIIELETMIKENEGAISSIIQILNNIIIDAESKDKIVQNTEVEENKIIQLLHEINKIIVELLDTKAQLINEIEKQIEAIKYQGISNTNINNHKTEAKKIEKDMRNIINQMKKEIAKTNIDFVKELKLSNFVPKYNQLITKIETIRANAIRITIDHLKQYNNLNIQKNRNPMENTQNERNKYNQLIINIENRNDAQLSLLNNKIIELNNKLKSLNLSVEIIEQKNIFKIKTNLNKNGLNEVIILEKEFRDINKELSKDEKRLLSVFNSAKKYLIKEYNQLKKIKLPQLKNSLNPNQQYQQILAQLKKYANSTNEIKL